MFDIYMKLYSEDDVAGIRNNVLNVGISPNTLLAYTFSFKYNIYFICYLISKLVLKLIYFNLNWAVFSFFPWKIHNVFT